ncbi:acyl-CoA thioesterase [Anaerobacillus alkalilacustris]|uniref:Acyl-CoA thioesterase n=1 Tax=Anaerobacillus alkalilacustris TaxID=393763 RepID=A0A1S2LP23_9BACI|nr:acyl-CoA thioesterase [Anaerobacillus alkalilacustris]OIJ13950.1 acyl-CoA thioesterase [Anaerobacillus alkalilacustris]
MEEKYIRESRVVQTDLVLPFDTNNHNTLFGGILMKKIDAVASVAVRRHCRSEVVTASTDSVDFLHPILTTDSVCLEAFVTWAGHSSMEVFVKVIAENLNTGERRVAATAFLTFVALNKSKTPVQVPKVIPETEEEIYLHKTAEDRAKIRKDRRIKSKQLAEKLSMDKPWDRVSI